MAIDFAKQLLFESPLLRVVDIRWRPTDGRRSQEACIPLAEITFQRTGMFVKNGGRHGAACDPNTLLSINAGEPYCLSHPATVDCACTALLISPEVVADMVGQEHPAGSDRPQRSFSFEDAPNTSELAVAHQTLFAAVRWPDGVDRLAVEEMGLDLARSAVDNALKFHLRRPRAAELPLSQQRR
jgi:hypothetical protein